MWQRGMEVWRGEGFAGLVERALLRLGLYRRLVIVGGGDQRQPKLPDLPLEYAQLSAADIGELHAHRPELAAEELRARFAADHWCFAARHAGRLVVSCWVCRGRSAVEYLDAEIHLADDTVYAYDQYVVPDLRGRGLATAIEDYRARAVAAAGCRRTVGLILPQNRAAWHHSRRRDDDVIGDLRMWRLGPWRRHALRIRQSRSGPMVTRVVRLR